MTLKIICLLNFSICIHLFLHKNRVNYCKKENLKEKEDNKLSRITRSASLSQIHNFQWIWLFKMLKYYMKLVKSSFHSIHTHSMDAYGDHMMQHYWLNIKKEKKSIASGHAQKWKRYKKSLISDEFCIVNRLCIESILKISIS